jgi:cyclin-dependent kinase
MTRDRFQDRPDCSKIISRKPAWAVSSEEQELLLEIMKISNIIRINDKNRKETFINFILQIKFGIKREISPENGNLMKNFEFLEKIGEGSYGEVFKCREKSTCKSCAIKKIECEDTISHETLNFFYYFSSIDKYNSERIVRHLGSWLENSYKIINGKTVFSKNLTFYIQMELCEMNLKEVIEEMNSNTNLKKNNKLTEIGYYIASHLFVEILEGVQFLHENKIIHRNLSPRSILIKLSENSGYIKINRSILMIIHDSNHLSHQIDVGSIEYMAPEVEAGGFYDFKVDNYSLGVIMKRLFIINLNR